MYEKDIESERERERDKDRQSQIYEMVDFANAVAAPDGGIEELVYNASVATINIAIFNSSDFNSYIPPSGAATALAKSTIS